MTPEPTIPDPLSPVEGGLRLAFDRDVAILTLNQPGRRNAIGRATWAALPQAVAAVAARSDIRVLIVRGSGGDFSAGADIAEFDTVFANRDETLGYAVAMVEATNALAACPVPTLAMITGHCIGAGVAVALACDIRCAAADARLGITPARLGLLFPLADSRRLVRAVGRSTAADLLFTGRVFSADEARTLRLIDELHPPARLEEAVMAKARHIAGLSAWSVRHAKSVLALIDEGVTDDTDRTRGWFADAVENPDHRARLKAFRRRERGSAGPA